LIPHNENLNQTLTACAPRMLTHKCVFASRRLFYSSFETRIRPRIMPVVKTSTLISAPIRTPRYSWNAKLSIEYP
jgi:hypothetical protein